MTAHNSRLALEAAGQTPLGQIAAPEDGHCALCGHAHAAGDRVNLFCPPDSFMDYPQLRRKDSRLMCGWCSGLWNDFFTQRALKSVICKDGVYPAASNANIAYWLLNPPQGDWMWVMGDQQKQHIVWYAPVNSSQDVFQIQTGSNYLLTIRRSKLLPALQACRRLSEIASIGRKGAALKSPFIRLSRDLDDPAHGAIRTDLLEMMHAELVTATAEAAEAPDAPAPNPQLKIPAKAPKVKSFMEILTPALQQEIRDLVRLVRQLTPGEIWAMTAMLYADPVKPEPLATPTLSQ